ncbi:hypothetical protein OK074_5317 [Actinobacteria bacterium OK074]|nr:hypothetical protein OK074_5317 [Actinobacteria bacterium OK074]
MTKVCTNRSAELAHRSRDGRYVIVELSPDDTAAALWTTGQGSGGGTGGTITTGGTIVAAKATLAQAGTVTTTRGTPYAADSTTLTTGTVKNLIVDDFQQFTFDDPATGRTLKYNLFVLKGYDPRKKYPLVLFMHDASVVNVATEGPLVQGLGAVCWASPADRARHESFVPAPEYGAVVIDDNHEPSTLFDATANLVEAVTKKKLWILVSADDTKAYPGEQASTEVIQEQGTQVGTALWDGRSTAAEFAADVRSMRARRTPVNFSAFKTGTTVPSGSTTSAHMGLGRSRTASPASGTGSCASPCRRTGLPRASGASACTPIPAPVPAPCQGRGRRPAGSHASPYAPDWARPSAAFRYGLARQIDELESLGTPRLAENVADPVGTLLAEHPGADRTRRHDDGREALTRHVLA